MDLRTKLRNKKECSIKGHRSPVSLEFKLPGEYEKLRGERATVSCRKSTLQRILRDQEAARWWARRSLAGITKTLRSYLGRFSTTMG